MPRAIPYYRPPGLQVKQRTPTERGYDAAWYRLAKLFKRHWFATHGPTCALCNAPLIDPRRTHCDHIVPFDGIDDPKRLDWNNLRCLCDSCNSKQRWRG
jgi:5-methylcytosine-specific restriction endonuclease McrA